MNEGEKLTPFLFFFTLIEPAGIFCARGGGVSSLIKLPRQSAIFYPL
jgi:hypothetical protein